MKLPNYKRIFKTDYEKEQQPLIEKLAASLNTGLEVLYELANKKISLRDNVLCTVKDVDLIVDSNGNPTITTSVRLDTAGRVDGTTVIYAINLTNSSVYPTNQPFISFTQTENAILVNNIKGLAAGYNWRVRLIIWQA